jgi:hypothetical protein
MAFKNQNVSPSRQPGTGAKGDAKPDANMPANNVGTFPVKLGSGQASRFPSTSATGAAQKGAQQQAGPKANMPANNTTNKRVSLGTTKHSVGTVPHYLRNPNNSGTN